MPDLQFIKTFNLISYFFLSKNKKNVQKCITGTDKCTGLKSLIFCRFNRKHNRGETTKKNNNNTGHKSTWVDTACVRTKSLTAGNRGGVNKKKKTLNNITYLTIRPSGQMNFVHFYGVVIILLLLFRTMVDK